jgi:hypothetical protein
MADACGYATSGGSFAAPLPAQSVTTFVQAGGPGTPDATGNLSATAVSGSQINLAWTNNATNATACLVARSSDNVYFTQIASLGAGATSYSDTGLPGSSTSLASGSRPTAKPHDRSQEAAASQALLPAGDRSPTPSK